MLLTLIEKKWCDELILAAKTVFDSYLGWNRGPQAFVPMKERSFIVSHPLKTVRYNTLFRRAYQDERCILGSFFVHQRQDPFLESQKTFWE